MATAGPTGAGLSYFDSTTGIRYDLSSPDFQGINLFVNEIAYFFIIRMVNQTKCLAS